MGLEVRMLDTVRVVSTLVNDIRLGKAGRDVAHTAMNFQEDILPGVPDAGFRTLVVKHWRSSAHCFLRIEDRREHLVLAFYAAASLFGGGLTFGHYGFHPLSDETRNVVQQVSVVRINVVIVMGGRGVETPRHILPGQHRTYTGYREG